MYYIFWIGGRALVYFNCIFSVIYFLYCQSVQADLILWIPYGPVKHFMDYTIYSSLTPFMVVPVCIFLGRTLKQRKCLLDGYMAGVFGLLMVIFFIMQWQSSAMMDIYVRYQPTDVTPKDMGSYRFSWTKAWATKPICRDLQYVAEARRTMSDRHRIKPKQGGQVKRRGYQLDLKCDGVNGKDKANHLPVWMHVIQSQLECCGPRGKADWGKLADVSTCKSDRGCAIPLDKYVLSSMLRTWLILEFFSLGMLAQIFVMIPHIGAAQGELRTDVQSIMEREGNPSNRNKVLELPYDTFLQAISEEKASAGGPKETTEIKEDEQEDGNDDDVHDDDDDYDDDYDDDDDSTTNFIPAMSTTTFFLSRTAMTPQLILLKFAEFTEARSRVRSGFFPGGRKLKTPRPKSKVNVTSSEPSTSQSAPVRSTPSAPLNSESSTSISSTNTVSNKKKDV